ncbi:MAG: P-II family nitrogen regulator [Elusimicrobia bacterium]|nr:P-II family nitrogen regulator [Elusimicrobiota bacterium]
MKLVSCIIRPEKLDAVKEALSQLNLVGGITVTDVRGFGRQKGSTEHYKGIPYTIRFIDKVKLDIAVAREDLERVLTLLQSWTRTGQVGDGKIFVMNVSNALRIRTGEKGVDAL